MNRRVSISLVALLALAVIAWVRNERVAERSTAESSADATQAIATNVQAAELGASDPTSVASAESAEPPVRAALELATAVESEHELWIVDAATRAPLAGARVQFADLEYARVLAWRQGRLDLGEDAEWLEREATSLTSDARGLVCLPQPKHSGLAIVRHGELFGLWWIDDKEPKPWTLELLPDQPWDVLARDEAGKPIAGLRIHWRDAAGNLLAQQRTDATGLARFEHARWRLAHSERESFEVLPMAILREPLTREWESRIPPAAPTELVMPDLGLVELDLRDPDGSPWTFPDQEVWLRDASGAREDQNDQQQQLAYLRWGEYDAYRVHAELGLELEAGWRARRRDGEVLVRFAGPNEAAEVVRAELVAGAAAPIFRMRLLDARGEPLASTAVRVELLVRSGSETDRVYDALRTDARAVLCVPAPEASSRGASKLSVALEADRRVQVVLAPIGAAERGWVELGDVRLAPAPLVAAGRVVDAAGLPVPGVDVELRGSLPNLPVDAVASNLPAAAMRLSRPTAEESPMARARTNALGAFELHSAEMPERVQLRVAVSDSVNGPWIGAVVGGVDHVLVVPRVAAVAGRVLMPPGLDAHELSISFRGSTGALELAKDGSWELTGQHSGPAEIEISASRAIAQDHLGRIDVELVAGTLTRAPDIDLRSVRVLRVRVVDEQHRPLDGWSEVDAGNLSVCHAQIIDGNALILTRHPRVEAFFDVPGFQRTWDIDLQDGAVIVLSPGQLVLVRLLDPSAVPGMPYQLIARLGPTFDEVPFEASGEVMLSASLPGAQRLQIEVRDTRWGANMSQKRPRVHVQPLSLPVEIPESGDPVELEIDVSVDYVADAIRRFEEE